MKSKKKSTFIPKVIATGALLAMLTSATPRPVLSYSSNANTDDTTYSASDITLENASYVNNYSQPAGVTESGGKIKYDLPGISKKTLWSYPLYTATVNGVKLYDYATYINGVTYLPLRAYFEALGASVSYNSSSRTMTITAKGLYLTASDGGYCVFANDRPIFSFSPNVIMSNGRMYVPASALTKITGQSFARSDSTVAVTGSFNPLATAKSYYREDEVFWLARIITAEAKGESLLGQIAVGNVILNRVNSPLYPNTIYGVIFDRKYGVQFSPVLDGSIYNTPSYTATLAAKICLEGTHLSGDALFFLNPQTAESNWIVKNREYAYTIGGHDFYK